MVRKPKANDDEDYPPQGGCIGSGSMQDMVRSGPKKPKRPIGFVIFPEKEKARKVSRPEVKRGRKR